jgi:hypothetical protein
MSWLWTSDHDTQKTGGEKHQAGEKALNSDGTLSIGWNLKHQA